MEKKLSKKVLINGTIELLTGLHIGGSNTNIQIGGIDTSVIRNPIDNKPYIPGSSLKGKIRTLLEQIEGNFGPGLGSNVKHGPITDPKNKITKLFGLAAQDSSQNIPSRIIFRDGVLIDPENKILNNTSTDLPYTEAKTEIVLDRITAAAMPRQIERVPAGVEFTLNIVVNIFSDDDEKEMMELVFNGMRVLQDDYLGGKGSRGCGQIKFHVSEVKERDSTFYYENNKSAEANYTAVACPEDLK